MIREFAHKSENTLTYFLIKESKQRKTGKYFVFLDGIWQNWGYE